MTKPKLLISVWLILGLLAAVLIACRPVVSSEPTVSPSTSATSLAEQETPEPAIITPRPRPTAMPGVVTNLVETITEVVGVEDTVILGLATADWINLGISFLIILFGSSIVAPLTLSLLRLILKRLPGETGKNILSRIGTQVKWLVATLFFNYAITRLIFLSVEIKTFFSHVFFVLYLVIIISGLWKLIDFGIDTTFNGTEALGHLLPLVHRVAHILLMVFGTEVLLGRFGIELGSIATAVGLGGLAISLAAQDVLSDLIAGFIILVSQPFRIGDRIEIQDLGTWGDVIEIGVRTTNIRTRDNRMVIVPNSIIGKSQVVNYTYPDPRYRVQIEIGIAYGTNIEHARQIIIATVQDIEGVLKDKPVEALYIAMGDSAMIFRVRWWIESYIDTRRNFDRVNTALQNALDAAGIEMPFPTQALNVRFETGSPGERDNAG